MREACSREEYEVDGVEVMYVIVVDVSEVVERCALIRSSRDVPATAAVPVNSKSTLTPPAKNQSRHHHE